MARNPGPFLNQYAVAAYPLLGVTVEQLQAQPRIGHLLSRVASIATIFDYLAGSEEPEVQAICHLRQQLTVNQQDTVPFEAYAVAMKMPTKKLFGLIMQEIMEQSTKLSALLAKMHHPEIVETSIEQAKKPAGIQDREMLHKAIGFLPTPKNSLTVVNGDQHINRNRVNVAVLPPLESVARDLNQRFIDLVPKKDVRAIPGRTKA